jgi:hypothetical protein
MTLPSLQLLPLQPRMSLLYRNESMDMQCSLSDSLTTTDLTATKKTTLHASLSLWNSHSTKSTPVQKIAAPSKKYTNMWHAVCGLLSAGRHWVLSGPGSEDCSYPLILELCTSV